ncbi:hypothetical protein JCM10207_006253, partial [Rhodosporidiobolus poonsookiae]
MGHQQYSKLGLDKLTHNPFNALAASAKPPAISDLLNPPIPFVNPKYAYRDDEVNYKPVNVKTPTTNGTSSTSPDPAPVASTSKLPSTTSSTPILSSSSASNSSEKRAFPSIDLSVTWARPHPVGAGLQNLGNTCFLNSALQCLLHTPPLVRYLESGAHTRGDNCDVARKKGFCMTCAMRTCVAQSFHAKKRSYAPTMVTKHLKQIAKHFRFGRQEDSHEFLRFAVDAMQASALFGKTKLPPALQHQTFVHQLFGGRLRSRVHCTSCGHNSDTFDSFLDLSLDLSGRGDSLKDALASLVKVDRLTGGNKYKCE